MNRLGNIPDMQEHEKPFALAFSQKLRAARTAEELSMAALAQKVEPPMTAPAIARYESGERVPTWTAVIRLATALGRTPDYFLPDSPKGKRKSRNQLS